jgi:hypothetical protein
LSIISLLSNTGYILANKTIASLYGIDCAVILGEFAAEYCYYEQAGRLLKDGWFFSTIENVKENTTLSEKKQRAAISVLQEAGILTCERKGVPAKRYIKINEEKLFKVFNIQNNMNHGGTSYSDMGGTRSAEMAELDPAKWQSNNNKEKVIKKENNKYRTWKEFSNGNEELLEACKAFEEMRKKIKKPLTDRARAGIQKKLQDLSANVRDKERYMVGVLDRSTENCWQGVFKLDDFRDSTVKAEIVDDPVILPEDFDDWRDLIP